MSISYGKSNLNDFSVGGGVLAQVTYGKTIVWEKSKVFEFIIDQTTDDPAQMIQYTGANTDFYPGLMNYGMGSFDYGSWKNTWLMKSFKPCMLHANGTIAYYLNPDNLILRTDGTDATSDLTSTSHDMNAMVEVSQIWIKEEEIDEDHFHIYLSPTKADGYDCWTHYDSNNELQDKYYFAMYKGSLDSNNKIRSLSGQIPNTLTEGNLQKQYCQANGAGWDCREWSFQRLMQYVLMLIGKSTDVQSVFGAGYSNSPATPLTTGGVESYGMFYGEESGNGHVVVFGMEDFWGNLRDLTNGLQVDLRTGDGYWLVKMTPSTADGTNGVEYTDEPSDYKSIAWNDVGVSSSLTNYIKKMKLIRGNGLLPITCAEYIQAGYKDFCYVPKSHAWTRFGGNMNDGDRCGIFYVDGEYALNYGSPFYGVSLSYK